MVERYQIEQKEGQIHYTLKRIGEMTAEIGQLELDRERQIERSKDLNKELYALNRQKEQEAQEETDGNKQESP